MNKPVHFSDLVAQTSLSCEDMATYLGIETDLCRGYLDGREQPSEDIRQKVKKLSERMTRITLELAQGQRNETATSLALQGIPYPAAEHVIELVRQYQER